MKKYIIIILIILGFVWYFNNPTIKLNRLYALDLSVSHTKKIIWDEEWGSNGDGGVVGLLEISPDDFLRLSKMCLNYHPYLSDEPIVSTYQYICSIKYEENDRDIMALMLFENQSNKYLFYELSLQ